jgi:hypothetical protein
MVTYKTDILNKFKSKYKNFGRSFLLILENEFKINQDGYSKA